MSINCVLKGTNISLSNGHKVIEKLKVKESLVAYTVDDLPPVQDERLIGINRITNFSGSFSDVYFTSSTYRGINPGRNSVHDCPVD